MNLLGIAFLTAISWWVGEALFRIAFEDEEYDIDVFG